jgi:hypothetical protein
MEGARGHEFYPHAHGNAVPLGNFVKSVIVTGSCCDG